MARPGRLVDPNTASSSELQTIPGIGPVLAARIIEYRETVAPFTRPEDLLNVPGIGVKTLEKIEKYLEFGNPVKHNPLVPAAFVLAADPFRVVRRGPAGFLLFLVFLGPGPVCSFFFRRETVLLVFTPLFPCRGGLGPGNAGRNDRFPSIPGPLPGRPLLFLDGWRICRRPGGRVPFPGPGGGGRGRSPGRFTLGGFLGRQRACPGRRCFRKTPP